MDFTGKIIAILPKKTGVAKSSGNPWTAQEFVIEDVVSNQYPRRMCFEVYGEDRLNQFNIQMGEDLTVSFDIDARQWQDRWFNSLRAWKVERVAAAAPAPFAGAPAPTYGAPVPPPPPAAPFAASPADDKDDLPF
ncbi:MAG: DUF3127 domain-containing protein [Prevotellaceae bacterium]|jgi:hypothetical protein|nr:DUF3127 domain-containing protein [Prevotellaceae bacterium]